MPRHPAAGRAAAIILAALLSGALASPGGTRHLPLESLECRPQQLAHARPADSILVLMSMGGSPPRTPGGVVSRLL